MEYYFKIIIEDPCVDNYLTLTSNLGYQVYYLDTDNDNTAGDMTITPAFTSDIAKATCPLAATLEYWNVVKSAWLDATSLSWLKSFATVDTGVIKVWAGTTLTSNYHPIESYPNNKNWTDVSLRVTIKDV